MALKNFSKIEIKQNNKSYWKIYKLDGTEVVPFSEWCLFIQNRYAYTTRDKYSQVVAKFLDYLVEANIFEQSVTRLELKEAVDNYKLLLHVGKSVSEQKIKKIAIELDFNKIGPASWANNISAINSFLKYVFEKEEDEREYWSIKHGVNIPVEFRDVVSNEKEYILTRLADANSYSQFNNPENKYRSELLRKDIVRNLNLIDYEDLNVTESQKIEVFCAMIKNMLESNQIGLNKLVEYDCFKTIEQQKNKQDKLFNNKQILLLK